MTDFDREMSERPPAQIRRLPSSERGHGPDRDRQDARTVPPGARGSAVRTGPAVNENFRAVYVISVAAELAGVHPQTLRIYERRGLVGPSRTGGGSRRYSPADIERLRHIGDLTAAGLNLEGVRRVLELEEQLEQLRAEIDLMRAEAAEAVERTHRLYRRDLVPVREASLVWRKSPHGSR
jgi:MerR family transcriptional regulator/heat shock protein HspR